MPFDPSQPFEVVEEPPSPTPTPVTHYSLGADVGGPDELQDRWTNKGYTSKGPNLTPGVVAVNPKIYPLGTILRDADTGEAFLATDTHGNKNPNVVDIYQPPDQYQGGSGTRNFVVAGRVKDIPKDPQGVQKLLAGYGKVPQGQSASDFLAGKKSGFDPSQPFEVVDQPQGGFDPSQPFEVVDQQTPFPDPVPTPEQGQPINLPAKEPEVIEMGEFTPTPASVPISSPPTSEALQQPTGTQETTTQNEFTPQQLPEYQDLSGSDNNLPNNPLNPNAKYASIANASKGEKNLLDGIFEGLGTSFARTMGGIGSMVGESPGAEAMGFAENAKFFGKSLTESANDLAKEAPEKWDYQIGSGIGTALSLMTGGIGGAVGQMTSQAFGDKFAETGDAGEAAVASLKAAPEMAAYWLLGEAGSKAVQPLLKNAIPLVKGLGGALASAVSNAGTSAGMRYFHGEPLEPTVAGTTQDVLFGILHGVGTGFKAAKTEAGVKAGLEKASTESLTMAATDPEFRRTSPYRPLLIDQELKRRAGQPEVLPSSPDPLIAATQAEIEAKANEIYASPLLVPSEGNKGRPTTLQEQQSSPLDTITQLKGTPYAEAIAPFEGFLKGEGIEVTTSDGPTLSKVSPEGKITINLETPKATDKNAELVLKAKVEEEIQHAASISGFLRDYEGTNKAIGKEEYVASRFAEIGNDLRQTASNQEVQNIIDIYTKGKGEEMSDAALGAEFSRQVWQELQSGRTTEQVQLLSELSKKGDAQAGTILRHLLDALMNFKETVSRYVDLEKAPQSLKDALETANKILDEYRPQEGRGAPPERFSPSDKSTSVKNAVVGEERIARGLPEREEPLRRSFGKVWDEAKTQVEADPTKGARLIEEMNKKPRPLSDTESAVLLNEKIKRDNEFDNAVDAVNNAKDGIEREDASRRLEAAREQVQRAYEATEVAGTKAGQALNARKMMVDKEEFTLSRMESVLRATANDGTPLTEKQLGQVKEAHDKIAELQKRVTELEEQARTKRVNEYFNKLLTDTKKEVRQTAKQGVSLADFIDIQATKARERVAKRRAEGRFMSGLDPVDLADHVIIGADYISKGVVKLADFTSRLVKDFGEEIRPYSQEIFSKSQKYRSELEAEQSKNKPKVPPAQKKIDQYTKAVETRTRKLEEKIAKGDYTRKTPEERVLDAKAKKALYDYESAKKRWNEGLLAAQRAKRPAYQRFFDKGVETINLARAIMTSFDFSAVLRQGGFITLAHPVRAAKSLPAMFKAFGSERGAFEANREIENRPNFPLYKQSKLALTSDAGSLSKMEEAYMSRWAKYIPIVAGSERAYTTFLNKLRADSFDAMTKGLATKGKPTAEEANAISNFINAATGRADLGKANAAGAFLNTVFFAPKYVSSRFQLLAGQPFYKGTFGTRKAIAVEYARYLASVGVIYSLAQAAGWDVEFDPRSSDFGKIRIGNTRIDPLSGLAQVTTFLGRTISGQTRDSKGKLAPLRDTMRPFDRSSAKVRFGQRDQQDVMTAFLRSKLAPAPGAVWSLATGKDPIGREATPQSIGKQLIIPLTFNDVYGAMKEQGIPAGTAISLISVFGASANTYDTTAKP